MAHEDIIEEIQQAIKEWDVPKIRLLVAKMRKRGPFNTRDKLRISLWHTLAWDPTKGVKICGPELSSEDIESGGVDAIALQVQLAWWLVQLGAEFTCRRILHKVEPIFFKKEKDIQRNFSILYTRLADLYRNLKDPEKMTLYSEKGQEHFDEKCEAHYDFKRFIIEAKLLEGKLEETIADGKAFLEKTPEERVRQKGAMYRTIAEALHIAGKLDEAEEYVNKGLEIFTPEGEDGMAAILLRVKADIELDRGNHDRARELARQSSEMILKVGEVPNEAREALFILYQIDKNKMDLAEQLSLMTNPNPFALTYALGRTADEHYLETHPKIAHYYEESDNNCWITNAGKITPAKYEDSIAELVNKDETLIDLYSGIIFKHGKIESTLPETQLRCLSTIASSGNLGVSKWTLIDIMYREEEFCFKYGEERLKQVIKELKKKGFEFSRKANYFYYDLADFSWVFPMDMPESRLQCFLKSLGNEFELDNVQSLFGVHKTTAQKWVTSWEEKGDITPVQKKKFKFTA